MNEYIWILRDSITGEPYTSTNEEPKDKDEAIEWNFSLAFWSKERRVIKEKNYA